MAALSQVNATVLTRSSANDSISIPSHDTDTSSVCPYTSEISLDLEKNHSYVAPKFGSSIFEVSDNILASKVPFNGIGKGQSSLESVTVVPAVRVLHSFSEISNTVLPSYVVLQVDPVTL